MQINTTQAPEISQVLQQMRAVREQMATDANIAPVRPADDQATTAKTGVVGTDQTSFTQALKYAVDSVNQLQKTSSQASTDFVTGKENDLVKVMIDSQKASLGFQALVQTRNRMVTAYQDIMNMPI